MACSIPSINFTADESLSANVSIPVPAVERALDWFHVVCAAPTALFNALVLLIALSKIDIGNRLNQVFVISMTSSDLLFGLVYMATKTAMICFSTWFCKLYYTLLYLCQVSSVVHLLLLNFDKFLSIHYPLHYHQIVTKKRVAICSSISWSFAIVIALHSVFGKYATFSTVDKRDSNGSFIEVYSACWLQMNPYYYLFFIIGLYVTPIILSTVLSLYIFWVAQYLAQTLPGIREGRAERRQAKQKVVKRVLFVFSSTLWTALTILPYRLAYVGVMLCSLGCGGGDNEKMKCQQVCEPPEVEMMVYILWFCLPLGAVGNPLITIMTQRIYRINCVKLLHEIFVQKLNLKCCARLLDDEALQRRDTRLDDIGSTKETDNETSASTAQQMLRLLGTSVRHKGNRVRRDLSYRSYSASAAQQASLLRRGKLSCRSENGQGDFVGNGTEVEGQ